MSLDSQNLPRQREPGLGYRDVARIAQEGAQRGLHFSDAQTVEPYSDRWIVRLRAADGTLHDVDSWPGWRALVDRLGRRHPAE